MDADKRGTVALRLRGGVLKLYKRQKLYRTLKCYRYSEDGWMGGVSVAPNGKLVAYIDEHGAVAVREITRFSLTTLTESAGAIKAVLSQSGQRIKSIARRLLPTRPIPVLTEDIEGELREVYTGLMGTKIIWTATFSFLPIVAAHFWSSVRVTLSPATAICLLYHGLGAYVWFVHKHVSSVDFRRDSRDIVLRKLYRYHNFLGWLSYPVVLIVLLIWSSQVSIVFFGEHYIELHDYLVEFLGIQG